MTLPFDYLERVYAGVLGKMIGVYFGRPVEGWTYQQIKQRFGEIDGYIHNQLGVPLVVTDDDLTGTFTFIRALEDYAYSPDLTAAQIGETWLNYIIENKTILWWGGKGNSTEHTAFLHLKAGTPAPESGSLDLNGRTVAEQIGAQIFIDGWGMVAPGDPECAAGLARRAATVSHDGEAVYAAQVIAAMEALAFGENDTQKLLDTALTFIPKDSTIARMIPDIRAWHAVEPDWRVARRRLEDAYGYDRYGGNVHVVPNHGLIILALLYGEDDFQRSLSIVTTAGWDTDCNAGNLGCLLGIKNGLAGINSAPGLRTPLRDRLYLPTSDGGRAISDALTEAARLTNAGLALKKLPALRPKNGARFHFALPGSVQGFQAAADNPTVKITVENDSHPGEEGARALAIEFQAPEAGLPVQVETATFVPSKAIYESFAGTSYPLLATPTLHPGQKIRAAVIADSGNTGPLEIRLLIRHYNIDDGLTMQTGTPANIAAGENVVLSWETPDTGGYPIASVGLQTKGIDCDEGKLYLDYLGWEGTPSFTLTRPYDRDAAGFDAWSGPVMWRRAWVNGLDSGDQAFDYDGWPEAFRLVQNTGRGLLMYGSREWGDYRVTARIKPHMCQAAGLAVHVQGLRRYYALVLAADSVRLVRTFEGEDRILAETRLDWEMERSYDLGLEIRENHLAAAIDGHVVLTAEDETFKYRGGGIALLVEEGRVGCDWVQVSRS